LHCRDERQPVSMGTDALGDPERFNRTISRSGFIGASGKACERDRTIEEALSTINAIHGARENSFFKKIQLYIIFKMEGNGLSETVRIKSQILAARQDRESTLNCLTEASLLRDEQS